MQRASRSGVHRSLKTSPPDAGRFASWIKTNLVIQRADRDDHGFDDGGLGITQVHAPEPEHAVERAVAVTVLDPDMVAAGEDAPALGIEGLVGSGRMQVVLPVEVATRGRSGLGVQVGGLSWGFEEVYFRLSMLRRIRIFCCLVGFAIPGDGTMGVPGVHTPESGKRPCES